MWELEMMAQNEVLHIAAEIVMMDVSSKLRKADAGIDWRWLAAWYHHRRDIIPEIASVIICKHVRMKELIDLPLFDSQLQTLPSSGS